MVLVAGLLGLGTAGCGDDEAGDIDLATTCAEWRDHDDDAKADALADLGPDNGWEQAADDGATAQVDDLCSETGKPALEDVIAAAARGEVTAAAALVETFCRQSEEYVAAVEEQASHLDDVDSTELADQGTDLTNASVRLQPVTGADADRHQACTRQATAAALLLTPG